MLLLTTILTITTLTLVSRSCGGGRPTLPSKGEQLLWAFLISTFAFDVTTFILSLIVAFVSKVTGHGRGFHYGIPFKAGSTPEKVEQWFIAPIFKLCKIPYEEKYVKPLIMGITGLGATAVLGASYAFVYHEYLAGFILAVGGSMKAVAYLTKKTELSEYLTGTFVGISLGLAMWLTT